MPSVTGWAHHFDFKRPIGCTAACASVLPWENSHERSGRPMFVSGLTPRHAPRLEHSLRQHHYRRRRSLIVQGPRSSLIADQDLRSHQHNRHLHSSPLGRSRTSQAQALFFSLHYSYYWRGALYLLTRQGRALQYGTLSNVRRMNLFSRTPHCCTGRQWHTLLRYSWISVCCVGCILRLTAFPQQCCSLIFSSQNPLSALVFNRLSPRKL